ncbi:MAG TPA: stage III sporulation protein AD [Candidatus Atribacteria bacterium]|nr:stage III sporulation protein AD [Candidatus Atribacteria bacterium]HPT77878.1 stage III sporulation protein AD [Candidatus Atribacteria bacterium]
MNIIQVVAIGLTAAVMAVIVKQQRQDIALLISLAAGTVIFLLVLGNINAVVETINSMVRKSNLDTVYITTILKVIGIAYIAEFGSQICKDAGETAIASKIEMGGKILIMILALPVLTALLEVIIKILP